MTLLCDGCRTDTKLADLAIVAPEGIQVRYCPTCTEVWRDFERALNAESARLQALNEIFQSDARQRCPLTLTPLDLPKVARDAKGQAVVLR